MPPFLEKNSWTEQTEDRDWLTWLAPVSCRACLQPARQLLPSQVGPSLLDSWALFDGFSTYDRCQRHVCNSLHWHLSTGQILRTLRSALISSLPKSRALVPSSKSRGRKNATEACVIVVVEQPASACYFYFYSICLVRFHPAARWHWTKDLSVARLKPRCWKWNRATHVQILEQKTRRRACIAPCTSSHLPIRRRLRQEQPAARTFYVHTHDIQYRIV
jgi:hypothetical protein